MRFTIGDSKVYRLSAIDDLTLAMLLELEVETAELGRKITVGDVYAMNEELEACKTDDERKRHPNAAWMLAICIWATRRLSGENITFGEAISFPMRDLTYLPEPADKKPPADPTRSAHRGSGAAAARDAAKPRTRTSTKASTSG
jgi:hypothetical protein